MSATEPTSSATVQAARRHRRTLSSELNRARRREDSTLVIELITQLAKLDAWLETQSPPSCPGADS